MNTNIIKKIISVANSLDSKGLTKESDLLDSILNRTAQSDEQRVGAPDVSVKTDLLVSPSGELYSLEDLKELLLDKDSPLGPDDVDAGMALDFIKSLMLAEKKVLPSKGEDGKTQYSRVDSVDLRELSELKRSVFSLKNQLGLSPDELKDFNTHLSMFRGDIKNIVDMARKNDSSSMEESFQQMLYRSKLREVEDKNPELYAAMSTSTPYSEEVRAILGGEYSIRSLMENGSTIAVKRKAAETGAKMQQTGIDKKQDEMVERIKAKLLEKKNRIFSEPNLARAKQEELIAAIESLDKEIKKNKHSKERRRVAVSERKRLLAEYEFYFDEEAPRSRSTMKRKRKLVAILRNKVPGMNIIPNDAEGKPVPWGKLDRTIREQQRALDETNPYIMELNKMIGSIDFWTRELQEPFTNQEVYDLLKAWAYDIPRQDLPKNLAVDIPRYGYISTRRDPRLVKNVLEYIANLLDVPFTTQPPFKSQRIPELNPESGELEGSYETQAPQDVLTPESRVEMFSKQVQEWGGESSKPRLSAPEMPTSGLVGEVPLDDDIDQPELLNPVLKQEDADRIKTSSYIDTDIKRGLVSLANHLDAIGYRKGADIIDGIIS